MSLTALISDPKATPINHGMNFPNIYSVPVLGKWIYDLWLFNICDFGLDKWAVAEHIVWTKKKVSIQILLSGNWICAVYPDLCGQKFRLPLLQRGLRRKPYWWRTLDFCFTLGQSLHTQMNLFAPEAAALSPQQPHVALQMGRVCQYGPKCEVWNDFPSFFPDTKVSWGGTGYRVEKNVSFVQQSLLSEERESFVSGLRDGRTAFPSRR